MSSVRWPAKTPALGCIQPNEFAGNLSTVARVAGGSIGEGVPCSGIQSASQGAPGKGKGAFASGFSHFAAFSAPVAVQFLPLFPLAADFCAILVPAAQSGFL